MYSKNCECSISSIIKNIVWTFLYASDRRLRHFYSSKRKREKREKRKRTVERHFCLMFSCWQNIFGVWGREKSTVSWIPSLFVLIVVYSNFCYILSGPLSWNVLIVFSSSVELISFACILFLGFIPLSLILANTSYCLPKQYKRIWKCIYSECHPT